MPTDSLGTRIKRSWNAFFNKDPTVEYLPNIDLGAAYSRRPDRPYLRYGNERTIIASIYNRIAMDVAAVKIEHVDTDESGRYLRTHKSDLNKCLTLSANKDQTGRAFIQDVVMSMLDEGVVAIVPIDTTDNPMSTDSYDIQSMRTGRIVMWYPDHVKVNVYNDRTGYREDLVMPKSKVAIIENPFYSVINGPTIKRLVNKLNILDAIDEQTGSGKMNMIIQLPFQVRSEAREKQAEHRIEMIEKQLSGSKFGIAYADATEHITQLSRPIENNMLEQIEYLTKTLYTQLNITDEILNGSANDIVMSNYMARTIEPIVAAIDNEIERKFLTANARTRGQSIMYFSDPFRLIPVTKMSDLIDKTTRGAIMTSNEWRQVIGLRPSEDPDADALRNKNLNQPAGEESPNGAEDMVGQILSDENSGEPEMADEYQSASG